MRRKLTIFLTDYYIVTGNNNQGNKGTVGWGNFNIILRPLRAITIMKEGFEKEEDLVLRVQ